MSDKPELRKERAGKKVDPMLSAMVEDVYTVKVKGALGVRADTGSSTKGMPTIEITSTDQDAINRVTHALQNANKTGLAIKVNKIKEPSKETLRKLLAEQSQKVDGMLEG